MLPHTAGSHTAHNTAIQHKNLLYWAIQQQSPVPRLLYCNTAIQRDTARYSHTAIQRHTVYNTIQSPSEASVVGQGGPRPAVRGWQMEASVIGIGRGIG